MANGEQEENQVGLQNLEEQKLLSTSESAKPEDVDDPQGEGADPWEYAHDPTFVENDNFWTRNKALLLTRGWVYGTHLIYDLDKRTLSQFSVSEAARSD
ncbi:hypothetical protein CMQ_6507 [Grosmannia clavigera kw1407]|uniref:Uncharacterized protein n=1 Tax=Grosmannia clavigera (strain kw1407 / UAMH 11150) TaxID=655863 RepID=F0X6N4_GROCL|nr:uncharacterized protein CMQ_6507 [Grosmannia clavigera kw1407]EFX06186.1 hypothetical protein CMQ_6507 [Grosmannia clavigera kw1407]